MQRKVAEGRSRYGALSGTVVMIMPSLRSGCVELFFCGGGRRQAARIHVAPARPPLATLRRICAWYGTSGGRLHKTRAVRLWGPDGNEICCRFFQAHRARLHWCELPPGAPDRLDLDKLLSAVSHARAAGFDSAEVRF